MKLITDSCCDFAFVVEHPLPTMPTILHPKKAVTSLPQDTIHSQQQTTVYVGKDVTATAQTPATQHEPEKIVIPVSSLYSGGTGRVSAHSTSVTAEGDDQLSRGEVLKRHLREIVLKKSKEFLLS